MRLIMKVDISHTKNGKTSKKTVRKVIKSVENCNFAPSNKNDIFIKH